MQIRDRIKELRRVPAAELRSNPKNWRKHSGTQRDALQGMLQEVGIANAMIARTLEDGSLMLIDGHLRKDTLGQELVPVLVLDVDEQEADKLLATLDPLAALATADAMQLDSLLREVQTGNAAVQQMLSDLAAQSGLYTGDWDGKDAQDVAEIDTYDPSNETVSIRLNDVPSARKDEVVAAVDAAVASMGFKCEVF